MNILIIKTGALGDVLRTTFLAQAFKDKYKQKNPKIFWLTSEIAKPLFVNNPYIDHILLWDKKLISFLKKQEFDIVINLEESENFAKLTSFLHPLIMMGFYFSNGKIVPSKNAKEWFDMSALGKKPENDILKKRNKKTYRQIISEIVEIDHKEYEPFLRLTHQQRKISQNFLRRHNLSRKDLIIGINTGSADRWPKSLPIKKTIILIDLLYKKYKAKILLFGGPNEIDRNMEISKLTKSPIIDTGCGNNLLEFPALISVCNLFITTDSLGLHIALALKRKTICLIGPTSYNEIDMYGLGKKVISKSKCLCCYKTDCKSMEKIDIKDILNKTSDLLKQKITFLITAFKEPNIGKSIEAALNQKTKYKYNIVISVPDKETIKIVKKYSNKNKNIEIFVDPGKGKSYALNILLKKIDPDILILSDGDIFVNENAIEEIADLFLDAEIGCVTGRPVPIEDKKTMFGYWANFLFESAHWIRYNAFNNNNFLECSGYLFAFRKRFIDEIPLDVAEDTIIAYYFWQKGYKIGYAPKATVFVKNVDNWNDWIEQKTRTAKAHETLEKYVDTKTTPRVKTFWNEFKGSFYLFLNYPENIRDLFWSFTLGFSRLYMWIKVFVDTKLEKKHYTDAWKRIKSTK